MSRYLITGATTPIGLELIDLLVQAPDTEHIMAVGLEPLEKTALDTTCGPISYHQVDLTRHRRVRRLLFGPARELKITALAHLAQHRSALDAGKRVRAINVEATRGLLAMAEQHPTLRRFVLRSSAQVYSIDADQPHILGEDHPLNLSPQAPQWIRDRVEADLTVCTRVGMSQLEICVLRMAECLAPDTGSQLYDYLQSRVCFRPAGFDPMLNVTTVKDSALALSLALRSHARGIFNIPACDMMPLSEVIRRWGRKNIPVPGPVMQPLYALRARALGSQFRYDLNRWRFHFNGVLDGSRARHELGFTPRHPVHWPVGGATAQDPQRKA